MTKQPTQAAKGSTLGPWRVLDTLDGVMIVSESNRHIATVIDSTRLEGIQDRPNAELIVRAVNSHEDLLEAVRLLVKEINLSKLNVRKDFSLMNAHACAIKAIAKAEGK